jgi:MFS family permease
MGISFWGISPARDSLLSNITPPEREGRTFGYVWTGIFIFSSFSPIIIGYIGDTLGLRFGFQILAVLTLLSILPILFLFSRYTDLTPNNN